MWSSIIASDGRESQKMPWVLLKIFISRISATVNIFMLVQMYSFYELPCITVGPWVYHNSFLDVSTRWVMALQI